MGLVKFYWFTVTNNQGAQHQLWDNFISRTGSWLTLSLSLPSYLSSSAGGEVVGVITLQCTGLTDVWCQGSEYSSAQDGGEESVFNQASIIDLGWLAG